MPIKADQFQAVSSDSGFQRMKNSFTQRSQISAPAETVFRWHTRAGAFNRLTPPWERVELISNPQGVSEGSRAEMKVRIGPFRRRWVAEHRDFVPDRQFRDIQVHGPFLQWEHTHRVYSEGPDACVLEDQIEYALPLGPLGRLLAGGTVRHKLERMFRYRHAVTAADIVAHLRYSENKRMNVLISGSTGLVGTSLIPLLTTGGHEAIRLVRSKSRSPSKEMVHWDPESGHIDPEGLEGLDAVVHLAGENIAGGRWTSARKSRILDSRVKGTRLLCESLARAARPPKVVVCASAIGFYGDRGDEELTESSASGTGFLAEVCREWEAAAEPARAKGIRVVHLRFGVILSPAGGALAKMLLPFKMGVGGIVGSGRQYMSWITLDDAVETILHALATDALSGPVNVVAPNPVTNREFTKTLGRVLSRPTIFPMPAFAARLAFGEMADELLLASARVLPNRLRDTAYRFRHEHLEPGLRHILGR
jgi:uncharacterized protein